MGRVLVLYGTSEGHTHDVAARIAEVLRAEGHSVDVVRAGAEQSGPLSDYDGVLVGGSIHMGSYQKAVTEFASRNRTVLESVPSGLFTVCLTAASSTPGDSEKLHEFVDGFVGATGWQPPIAGVFAGALQYTKYGFVKRKVMKRIARDGGMSEDTSRDWDYTDWQAVEAFASDYARLLRGEPAAG